MSFSRPILAAYSALPPEYINPLHPGKPTVGIDSVKDPDTSTTIATDDDFSFSSAADMAKKKSSLPCTTPHHYPEIPSYRTTTFTTSNPVLSTPIPSPQLPSLSTHSFNPFTLSLLPNSPVSPPQPPPPPGPEPPLTRDLQNFFTFGALRPQMFTKTKLATLHSQAAARIAWEDARDVHANFFINQKAEKEAREKAEREHDVWEKGFVAFCRSGKMETDEEKESREKGEKEREEREERVKVEEEARMRQRAADVVWQWYQSEDFQRMREGWERQGYVGPVEGEMVRRGPGRMVMERGGREARNWGSSEREWDTALSMGGATERQDRGRGQLVEGQGMEWRVSQERDRRSRAVPRGGGRRVAGRR